MPSKNHKLVGSWEQRNPDRNRAIKSAWKKRNRDKLREYRIRHKAKYPEKFEIKNFRSKMAGLRGVVFTLDEYRSMNAVQNGCCAICGKPDTGRMLSIDHDHKTLKVRDLLCKKCNSGLGFFGDSLVLLKKAVLYLKRHAK